jgi:hypothetical protein
MIWNTIPNDQRLSLWKNLRNNISNLTVETQIIEIAKFYAGMPYGARTIDYYTPDSWPTPWEILFYGEFCTSSISLLIYYTATLSKIPAELHLVEDHDGIYLLPVLCSQYILNYELGMVNTCSEVSNNFKLLKVYTNDQIKEIQ